MEIARTRETRPHISEKIVLAAGALQHLPPNAEEPPDSRFIIHGHTLLPGTFSQKFTNELPYLLAIITVSPMLYGLVHFLAWNDQFPTPRERLLWRVSSLTVTFTGLIEVFAAMSMAMCESLFEPMRSIISCLMIPLGVVAPLAYVLASGFLIVESTRQLFFLNDGAYQLPSWSNYWPHFS